MDLACLLLSLCGVAAGLSLGMTGAWLAWRQTGNSGWVDTIWTFSVGTAGIVSTLASGAALAGPGLRQEVVMALAAAWSLRLGLHIARRSRRIEDDPRYARLTSAWGADANRQMFWLLQKQALASIPLPFAICLAASNPVAGFRAMDFLGLVVLATAIAGEMIADRQLRRFQIDPFNRGQLCDTGLWAWSRHPNYFFQWLGWLAYPLFAIDTTGVYSWGWLALAAPACMYWLLVNVSGIPPLEEHMLATRGDAFRDYQSRTSAFFPAPPNGGPRRQNG